MDLDALDSLPSSSSSSSSLNSSSSSFLIFSTPSPPPSLPLPHPSPSDSFEDGNVMNRPLVKCFFLFAYILVFVSCVVGNSMVLICIIANRSMRTVTNFFLANLAIADLLVGIFCVCQNAAHFVLFAHGTWPFGRVLCHAYVYILHMIPNSSAGILVLLSVERFIAVLRPMLVHQLLTKSVLCLCTALVWSLSALMNVPYLIAVQYIELYNVQSDQRHGICTRRFLLWSNVNILQLVSSVNLLVWYVLPLLLLFSIYASIGLVLIRTTDDDSVARTSQLARGSTTTVLTRNRGSSMLNGSVLNRNGSGGGGNRRKGSQMSQGSPRKMSLLMMSNNNSMNMYSNNLSAECSDGGAGSVGGGGGCRRLPKIELVDSRRRVIRLCAVIVLAFAVLSLPRYIYFTWSVWREVNAPRCLNCLSALVQPTTFLLMFFASGINPILYAFLSQRFRSAVRDTFSFRKRKEQRKAEMMLLLRNHRLSEQTERDPLGMAPLLPTMARNGSGGGAPGTMVSRTMSYNAGGNAGGGAYREVYRQKRRSVSQQRAEEEEPIPETK